eukprot:TRINITY_DN11923_c0_g1_i1.p1 TRINITY_DN11923_c0_g1~~TRINITY_DN11923_c0_g1_i1.p1  ORF type:complete len:880 (-),score=260.12 TRINITY_DN11923_c0_g1_i1:119-2758(-)
MSIYEGVNEEEIISSLEEGEMYEDEHFPPTERSLYRDPEDLPKYAKRGARKDVGEHLWLRPHEIVEEPVLFGDDSTSSVIKEGDLPDSWLIGALAIVKALRPEIVENLVLSDDDTIFEHGIFGAQFFKEGEWQEVTVDTMVPCGDANPTSPYSGPVYAKNSVKSEFWLPLMEKAYASLHGSYESLVGGNPCEALADITGGVAETIRLTDDKVQSILDTSLWNRVSNYLKWGCIIGCSINQPGASAPSSDSGLLPNKMYCIKHLKEVRSLRFVKVYSPWCNSGLWKGDWCHDWEKWIEHPDVEGTLKDDAACDFNRDGKDGCFWMLWEDFVRQFNVLYLCRLFSEEFNQYTVGDEWSRQTAGGDHKKTEPNTLSSKRILDTDSGRCRIADGDPEWFKNPQYLIDCKEPTDLLISLSQQNKRMPMKRKTIGGGGKGEHARLEFVLLKRKKGQNTRLMDLYEEDVVCRASDAIFHTVIPEREIVHSGIQLSPEFTYALIPSTTGSKTTTSFTIRLFSRQELSIAAVPDFFSKQFEGSWARGSRHDSSGGPMFVGSGKDRASNPKWCQNPQFFVSLPKKHHPKKFATIKIVCRRTNKMAPMSMDAKPINIGLTCVKVYVPPEEKKRKTPGAGATTTMNNVTRSTRMMTIDEEESSTPVECCSRLVQIPRGAWCLQSDHSHPTVAVTTLLKMSPEFLKGGLVIVPNLTKDGEEGTFSISFHSNVKLECLEIPDDKQRTQHGEWTDSNSKGCHMHSEWKQNPHFSLRMYSDIPVPVKITLERPEKEWRIQKSKDPVGSMIGFYIVPGTRVARNAGGIFFEGRPWNESAFVPMNEVSTPDGFMLEALPDNDVYTIVPATFNPAHKGSFFLTVACDSKFSLRKERKR